MTNTKRGRGRPSKGEQARSHKLGVRVSPEEFEFLSRAAAREGKTVTAWVRDAALNKVRKAKESEAEE